MFPPSATILEYLHLALRPIAETPLLFTRNEVNTLIQNQCVSVSVCLCMCAYVCVFVSEGTSVSGAEEFRWDAQIDRTPIMIGRYWVTIVWRVREPQKCQSKKQITWLKLLAPLSFFFYWTLCHLSFYQYICSNIRKSKQIEEQCLLQGSLTFSVVYWELA